MPKRPTDLTTLIGLLMLLCAPPLLAGCEDDDDDGDYDAGGLPASFDPGVEADKLLSALTDEEQATLCERAVSWGQGRLTRDAEAVNALCLSAGLTEALVSADPIAACDAAVETCKGGPFPSWDVCDENVDLGECDAEVEAYQTCLVDNTNGYAETFGAATCTDLLGGTVMQATPASCETLWDACPSLDMRQPGGDADAGM